jgi:HAE1 family hydrophobic/amphiphilic exporter-1
MTALSTIFGMIPVALSDSQGSEFRKALGVLILGGLSSSTILTLVVVPVGYTLLADAQNGVNRLLIFLRLRKPAQRAEGDVDRRISGPAAAE